ncbi:MAG: retropepsin-like aspartic protease [Pedobacter sp.]|jgi:predicted aspartyl protease
MSETRVPLELINLHDDGFHLLVEVVVFGQSFNVVLDTGASKTVFDKVTIEKHMKDEELVMSDRLSTGLGTNTMESHTIILPVLKIGKLKLKNFEAAILDLSTIKQAYSSLNLPPVIGVLGGDILYRFKAIINYKKLHLKLFR